MHHKTLRFLVSSRPSHLWRGAGLALTLGLFAACDVPAVAPQLDTVTSRDVPELSDGLGTDAQALDTAGDDSGPLTDTTPDVAAPADGLIADSAEADTTVVADTDDDTTTATDVEVVDDTHGEVAAPLLAPLETWTWVPIEGSACGNGTTNGLAVNLTDRSTDVVIILQGGGLCWDYNTCFVLKSAAHIEDTLNSNLVLGEIGVSNHVFDREDPENPFRNASFVFAPYCTGDFFAGNSVTDYNFLLDQRVVNHVGARNWEVMLPRLKATLPNPEHVWLAGFSAGGLGVTWNWWRFLALYPDAEVHALNDCGTPLDPTPGRFAEWKAAVKFVGPPDCADCLDGQPQLLLHYAATVPAPNRYALLAYRQDLVLQLFTGLDWQGIQYRTDALRAAMIASDTERMKTYFIDGTEHVMLGRYKGIRTSVPSGGVLAWDWVRDWALGADGWEHAGP